MNTAFTKIAQVLSEEVTGFTPDLSVLRLSYRLLPTLTPAQLAGLMKRVGCRLGPNTLVYGLPRLTGKGRPCARLSTGSDCVLGFDIVLDLQETIELGDRVEIGPGAMILTSSHQLGPKQRRAGPLEFGKVVLGNDVVVGARAIILPGVNIGDGALVEPGAVLNKDVPAGQIARGNPAVIVKKEN